MKVTNIKYLETRNGVAFTADLINDAPRTPQKIGVIENAGNGGGTWAYCINKHRHILAAAMECAGYTSEENYLDHLMDQAEGVTREQDIDQLMALAAGGDLK